jgi:hypothetical protein
LAGVDATKQREIRATTPEKEMAVCVYTQTAIIALSRKPANAGSGTRPPADFRYDNVAVLTCPA